MSGGLPGCSRQKFPLRCGGSVAGAMNLTIKRGLRAFAAAGANNALAELAACLSHLQRLLSVYNRISSSFYVVLGITECGRRAFVFHQMDFQIDNRCYVLHHYCFTSEGCLHDKTKHDASALRRP